MHAARSTTLRRPDHESHESHESPLAALGDLLTRAARRIGRWRALYRQRRDLADLDSRMLDDIGVSRADAEREARRPFWREARQPSSEIPIRTRPRAPGGVAFS